MVDGGLGGNELIYFSIVAIDSIYNGGAIVREIDHVGIVTNRIPAMHIGGPLWGFDPEYSQAILNWIKFGVRFLW